LERARQKFKEYDTKLRQTKGKIYYPMPATSFHQLYLGLKDDIESLGLEEKKAQIFVEPAKEIFSNINMERDYRAETAIIMQYVFVYGVFD
jgi:hypothetical protein